MSSDSAHSRAREGRAQEGRAQERLVGAWRASFSLLCSQPGGAILRGAALAAALFASVFGVGLIVAPWVACALLSGLSRVGRHTRVGKRRLSYLPGVVWVCHALTIASLALLGGLWLSTVAGRSAGYETLSRDYVAPYLGSALGALAGCSLWNLLLYAPLAGTVSGHGMIEAVAHSVARVRAQGFAAAFGLQVSCQGLQALPVAIAGGVAVGSAEPTAGFVALLSVPLLSAVSLPLGQGLLVARFLDRPDFTGPPVSGTSRVAGLALLAVTLCFGFGVVSLSLSLVRPARLGWVPAPPSYAGLLDVELDAETRSLAIPGTSLKLVASTTRVSIEAADGGGAGMLPLGTSQPVDRLRLAREGDDFVLWLSQRAGTRVAVFDSSGVRQRDDLGTRLMDRAPRWAVPWILLAAALCGILLYWSIRPAYVETGAVYKLSTRSALVALLPAWVVLSAASIVCLGLGVGALWLETPWGRGAM